MQKYLRTKERFIFLSCIDKKDYEEEKARMAQQKHEIFPEGKRVYFTLPNGDLHGKLSYFWSDGIKSSECMFVDGKKHGLEKTWDKHGQLLSETNWRGGKKHGQEIFWRDSRIKSFGHWENGQKHGEHVHIFFELAIQKIFYDKGKVLKEIIL
uniref:MORN repeat containing protein n=1 Tax=Marseillevirus sp. TaxID=2809551 RepID=A0AA96IXY1_9VIRU|nr:MORN repeat containing protein [Marseillevirus sp.]